MITIVVFKCMNGKWIYHSRSCKENRVFQSIHFLVHTNMSVTHVWKHYNRLSYVSVFNTFTRYQTMFHTFRCIFSAWFWASVITISLKLSKEIPLMVISKVQIRNLSSLVGLSDFLWLSLENSRWQPDSQCDK